MNSMRDSKKPSVMKAWLKYYDHDAIAEEVPKNTLYDYLFQGNKDHLGEIALSYIDNEITYGELFENIRKTASAYMNLGVKAGDIVTICSVTTPEIIYSFYAVDLIGATLNMIDPRTSIDGIRGYLREAKSKYICVLNKVYPKIHEAVTGMNIDRIVIVSPEDSQKHRKRMSYHLKNKDKNIYSSYCIKWKQFIRRGEDTILKPVPYREGHCAVVVHTGGTTGSPKGVMLNDDAFNALAFQYGKLNITFKRQQKFLNVMPPYIAYGLACGIHMPLSFGLTSILIPNLDPKKLAFLILKYKPAYMCGVPVHYQVLANDKRMRHADISYLLNSGSGGDAITIGAEIEVNRFLKSHGSKYPLAKGYGMTELCSTACTCMGDVNKPGSVGIPLIKNTVSAFEYGTDTELNIGEKGEICITGPTIMLGYYGKQEETANVLRKHSDGTIWVHTGDVGYIDEDGFVFVEARIKRMIIRHDGFKVFPSMIENVISIHPAVETCSVVGSRDKTQPQGNLPYVYIVLKKNVQESQGKIKSEIIKLCLEKLPEYAQPVAYKFCDSLYYTPIGKVDYRKLEKEAV
ncbi:MAG: class I adenylate-forming enzyme family protein [Anaerocolumna sp.]